MTPRIVVLGALDTKADEVAHLADAVERAGGRPVVVDTSASGTTSPRADVEAAAIVAAAGTTLEALQRADRATAVRAVADGAVRWLQDAVAADEVDGLITAGGSNAALVFQHAASVVPFGRPKVAVTTMAVVDARAVIGEHDVTLLYPVTDVDGLNRLTRTMLDQGAAAVVAMARVGRDATPHTARPVVGATMFGITTAGVQAARRLLEARDDEVVVFHANGTGGRSLERLAADGAFDAVLDVTTTELADLFAGGQLDAGEGRLDPSVTGGPPRVVAPGAVDTINFGRPDRVPEALRRRPMHVHNDNVTLVRTDPDDNRWIGARLGSFVAAAPNRLAVVPLRGVSSLDVESGPFHWPEASAALIDAIEASAGGRVRLVDAHVNDPAFAEALVAALDEVRGARGST